MTPSLTLAASFDPASRDRWLDEVRRVLLRANPDATDADFERAFSKRLVSETDDGIEIAPLYTQDDVVGGLPLPGQAPYLRGSHTSPRPWEIRQRVWPDAEGSTAVQELESGATGVLLTLDGPDELAAALQGVLLDLAPVSLSVDGMAGQVAAASALLAAWDAVPADGRAGCLGLDPMGAWARSGGGFDLRAAMDQVAEVVRTARTHAPGVRVVVVDGTVWHDAGATDAQELAWTLASGVWLVRELVTRGVALDHAAATLEFRLAATDDQFATIAKLRAARVLWARIAEVAGLAAADRRMHLHAEGSRAMLTRYDIWVNALRSTVACFAAAVGGADAITVLPHDLLMDQGGSSLGRRVARNTQTILQMESHLDRVVDPAGGSWYVESLTKELGERAWRLVQESDRAGGVVEILESQAVQAAIAESLAARRAEVATRKRPVTGLTEFPNIDDPAPPGRPAPNGSAVRFAPLTLHRLADEFEDQRARVDRAAGSGKRPLIYLATLGTAAQSTARATYAKNFFEAAGIRTVAGPVADFPASGATVACVCSSDPVYAEAGAAAAAELRAAGATRVYLAGRGADVPGVDEEVGLGVDVLEVLNRALDSLGVAR